MKVVDSRATDVAGRVAVRYMAVVDNQDIQVDPEGGAYLVAPRRLIGMAPEAVLVPCSQEAAGIE